MRSIFSSSFGSACRRSVCGHGHGHPLTVQSRNTTILCVKKDGKVAMVGDGLVTQGNYKVKPNALKVRTIGKDQNMVMCGFAGVTADCLALLERLEMKLEEYPGQLIRASVELAKMWRLDKAMRQLNATVLVANGDAILELTGTGDCLEPHDGVIGIGSGGAYACAAARAFVESGADLSAKDIAVRSCQIAADMDTATNSKFVIEEIECKKGIEEEGSEVKKGGESGGSSTSDSSNTNDSSSGDEKSADSTTSSTPSLGDVSPEQKPPSAADFSSVSEEERSCFKVRVPELSMRC